MAMKLKFNKTDTRYWMRKVSFHTRDSRTYSVHIQHDNQRRRIGLKTTDKEQAGALALEFYLKLRALGWEETLRWWKGDSTFAKRSDVTIGEYIGAVVARSLIYPKTIESYAQALRKIAGDIARQASREKRDAIKLRMLTPEKIEAWRIDFIRQKATDPLREKSARVSANSLILRARALFGPATVAGVRDIVEITEPAPFAGVKVEKVRVSRYRATFDIAILLESARGELAAKHPEQFKIFLLGAMAGLRRNEIDVLPWSAFRWNEGVIRITATQFFRPKSRESEGDVLVDPELIEIFRGYHARAKSDFVIESDCLATTDASYGQYRCQSDMRELIGWLRSKGVVSRTPLHTLRKEYGSQINARYGLTAAQEMLRHADVAVTAAHYVENKQRSVLGFGHLLKSERTIIPIRDEAPRPQAM